MERLSFTSILKTFPSLPAICFLLIPMLVLAGCQENADQAVDVGPPGNGDQEEGEIILDRVESEDETFRVVRLVDNLEHPWGVAWLPDGQMLITERPGRMLLVDGEGATELSGLPEIQANRQGGLLDVTLHPDYEENGWVYFTYSAPVSGGTGTSLARARIDSAELVDLEVIYTQEPGKSSGRHYGSRIVFPGDGTVLFTIGDRGLESPSQDLTDPTGSTIRLTDSGEIPDDNPFINHNDRLPEIFTYGHRNAQGMAVHPETGVIWQHEHGPRGGDELNIIRAGENYGWPEATYGTTYGGNNPIGIEPHESDDFVNPVVHWSPLSIAPSGMAIYTGDHFPNWNGDIFVGALTQQHLRRVVIEGEEVVRQEELLRDDLGRIRDVRTGPDGFIYILTDESNGGLYRLEPVD